MAERKKLVGGNWKMNGTRSSVTTLVELLNKIEFNTDKVEVVVAPVALHLSTVRSSLKKEIGVSGQNCYTETSGAFTGEVSAEQLKDFGIEWVILGHSERRSWFHESSELIAKKVKHALDVGLKVIFCCGETEQQRKADQTQSVLESQLKPVAELVKDWSNVVIAYEPVWAIGTGQVATPQQAQEVHAQIREWLKKTVSEEVSKTTRIIYGGSVSGSNCASLHSQPDIDGFLVGGASLKPEFETIVKVWN
eukprot:TRINITY_DN1302_c0_g1_i1.p1 TRINITY_DN1302_c0_g1~~TRINITY_DN1302_c0_g1_i1.p1  ORF type:complete len:280 (-),score=71.53 TRINITY_DN1302_c0_g1_i1:87-836(-)